ncbi:MAG: iron-sulfur cluster assembly scaffold protein [Candidatus Latescibacterota bacterium]
MPHVYSETVLDHFRHPRNVGCLEGADAVVGRAENSACGDRLDLYLRIREGRIVQASFRSFGCTAAIAAGSCLTEMLAGVTLSEAEAIRKEDVARTLGGLPPLKVHCSVLAEDAVRAALAQFRSRS